MRRAAAIQLGAFVLLAGALRSQNVDELRPLVAAFLQPDHRGALQLAGSKGSSKPLAFGLVEPRGEPVTPAVLWPVDGCARLFTALVVLRLSEQARLDRSAPIEHYLGSGVRAFRQITVQHLLDDRAGLPATLELTPADAADRVAFLARVRTTPLPDVPGRRTRTSDVGYGLLAAIVEEVTGQPFERVVRELVLQPLGLQETWFLGDAEAQKRARVAPRRPAETAARGYDWTQKGRAGLIATIADLGALFAALGRMERIGDVALWERTGNRNALGFERLDHHGRQYWSLAGDDGVVRVLALLDRERAASLCLVSDADVDQNALRDHFADIWSDTAGSVGRSLGCLGVYRDGSAAAVEIALEGRHLVALGSGQEVCARLLHGSPEMPEWPRFYDEVEERAAVLLRPVLQLDAASARRSFHPEAPPNAADEALALVQELVHTHGEVRERRLVGTSSGLGLRTFYQVRFGHTWVTLAIEWQGEKVRAVRRSEEQWPFRVVLQRLDDGRLVGKSIDGRVDLAITIVGKRLELHGRPDSKPFVATRVPATPPR